jgi:radical SAM protein with 4Fe4S-binding SPASM domain
MASCKEPFVSVSLDGADAETHEWVRGVPGCFDAALEGLRNLVEAGFRPQVIMTIMRHNKDQMEPAVQLAERLGENTLSASTPLRLHYDHPLAFRSLGKMFGENGNGCGPCGILSILGVLANGSYALCGVGETVSDLVFGRAATDPLEEIWSKTTILLELREGLPHRLDGICGDCLMKGICLGNCLAQNYYRNKNLWKSFWYCGEAHSRGLFPRTRILQ